MCEHLSAYNGATLKRQPATRRCDATRCAPDERKGSSVSDSSIVIRGAREHNLRDIDVTIPRDKLVVITASQARASRASRSIRSTPRASAATSRASRATRASFLGQMDKPDLDSIDGLSPAVSIDQKTTSKNPRSTVGTVTEIYDYLRLLFAPHRHAALPGMRPRHRAADDRPGGRQDPRGGGGPPRLRARPGGDGPQGRVRQASRRPSARGVLARAHRWRRALARRPHRARQEVPP